MWWNYLLVGVPAPMNSELDSIPVINVTGLAVGLASCILILLFVQQQQSFESGCRAPSVSPSCKPR